MYRYKVLYIIICLLAFNLQVFIPLDSYSKEETEKIEDAKEPSEYIESYPSKSLALQSLSRLPSWVYDLRKDTDRITCNLVATHSIKFYLLYCQLIYYE